ncbi:MAG: alpha-amylase family glycosyl hydrolase [Myxococcota bacterium]|nr:alpha-amylase family glycosyl hydrolase [Myxococcota bacterium]
MRAASYLGLACLLLTLAGCLPRPAPLVLETSEPVLVAFVHDREDEVEVDALPEELSSALLGLLQARNLEPEAVGAEEFGGYFQRARATGQRLDWLRRHSGRASMLLLVETRAKRDSQMEGRWRWTVSVRASIGRSGSGYALDLNLELPVFLQFGHQDETDALLAARATILRRLDRLLDTALAEALEPVGVAPIPTGPSGAGPIYFVLVDRFANGDAANDVDIDLADPAAFHGGDLRGVIDRLDHLESLGVGAVWLSPVFTMRTEELGGHGAFHGYWLEDPYSVEPRFGSEADLRELADALHDRGMKLYLDIVTNHVGYEAPLVTEHPDWFHQRGDIVDWGDPDQAVYGDVHGLPDLAQEKPAVRDWLVAAGEHWIERTGADGFRLDAVRHVPLDFWADYNDSMRVAGGEDFVLLGEMFDGSPGVVAEIQRRGKFSAMFDFPLYYALVDVFCRDAHPGRLGSVLWADRLYADPGSLVTFVDNHDLPRAVSACGGDLAQVGEMLRFLFAVRGTPSITWGTESGLAGAGEPENRRDMPWEAGQPLADLLREGRSLRPEGPGGRLLSLDSDGFRYLRRDGVEVQLRDGSVSLHSSPTPWAEVAPGSVALRVSEAPVSPSDRVVLVGAGPELGDWQPEGGLDLPVQGQAFPAGAVLDFKLAVIRSDGGVLWEERPNRYLLVEEGAALDLHLIWNS